MVGFIEMFNFILLLLFSGCYLYQVVYVFIGLFKKEKPAAADGEKHRYAVLIPARNEEAVIGGLLESIRKQDYPQELISVYVIADNCTDRTAECSEQYGAKVIRRFNKVQVGKGYALDYALKRIDQEEGIDSFDGFLVFDADNVLDPGYFSAMNRTYSQGYEIITSYRNSKNYGTNWITAGYGLWFIRESRFLNGARMKIGSSCAISGTGFLVSSKVIRQDGGWKYHLLTEDIEFSTDHIIRGYKIGYCKDAVLYDEQPETFKASWNQRLRWTKGFYQVFAHFGRGLLGGIFKRHSFQCYDMLMVIAPATLITLTSLGANLIFALNRASDRQPDHGPDRCRISLRMPGQHLSVPVPLRNGDADSGTEADLLSQMETDPLPVYFPGVYLYLYSHGGGRPAEESDLDPDSPHHPLLRGSDLQQKINPSEIQKAFRNGICSARKAFFFTGSLLQTSSSERIVAYPATPSAARFACC